MNSPCSVAEYDQSVCLNTCLDQLTETGNAETFCNIVSIFTLTLGFIFIKQTATLGSCDADDQVKFMFFLKFSPLLGDISIILRRYAQTRRVIDAIVVEENAKNLMPLCQGSFNKLIGWVCECGNRLDGKFKCASCAKDYKGIISD